MSLSKNLILTDLKVSEELLHSKNVTLLNLTLMHLK